jgi:hypothetical protein
MSNTTITDNAVQALIEHFWHDEYLDYRSWPRGDRGGHIFESLFALTMPGATDKEIRDSLDSLTRADDDEDDELG